MILLDTNVLIYAFDPDAPFCRWARETIVGGVAGDGVAINAVSLAEICVGDADPPTVADRIRSWGVEILDVPAVAAAPVPRPTSSTGSGGCRSPTWRLPPCRSPTFSLALMPRSWAGNSPPRIEAGSMPTSLLFRSRCRID